LDKLGDGEGCMIFLAIGVLAAVQSAAGGMDIYVNSHYSIHKSQSKRIM
jgi:hypothetical protein